MSGGIDKYQLPSLAGLFQPAEWVNDAACKGMETDLFFPPVGSNNLQARQVCDACPVLEQCRNYARQNSERHGVWGGESPKERRSGERGISRRSLESPIPASKHGSEGGYQMHRRRGEQACTPCLAAHSDRIAAYKRRRRNAAA